jgi:hypothetical protein
MKRIWVHFASLFVAATTLGALAPACAENDQTIFIRGALAPSANRQAGICVYSSDPGQALLFGATLDIGLTDFYSATFLVGNQMVPRNDNLANRTESNRVHLKGGVVKVRDTDGNTLREFTSYGLGFVEPQTGTTPATAPLAFNIFDSGTKAIILPLVPNRTSRKSLLVAVKVFGTTLGGKEVESGEFELPMEVCNGCLVDFSTGNDPAEKVQPNCKKALVAAAGGTTTQTAPCLIGQDGTIPCQACVGFNPRCDPAQP